MKRLGHILNSRVRLVTLQIVVLVTITVSVVGIVMTNREVTELRSDREMLAYLVYEIPRAQSAEVATLVESVLSEPFADGRVASGDEISTVVARARAAASDFAREPDSTASAELSELLWRVYQWYGPFIRTRTRGLTILVSISAFGVALALSIMVGLEMFSRRAERDRRRAHEFARNRIAVISLEQRSLMLELHDTVSQNLASAQLLLSTLDDSRVHDSRRLLGESRRTISDIARRLYPAELDQIGFASALEQLVDEFTSSDHIDVSLRIATDDDGLVPHDVKIHVYRIAQEALTNAMTHSQARRVTVVLERIQDTFWLVISDDGRGFHRDLTQGTPGFGLMSMTERANIIGGTLAVLSRPGEGTRVSLQFSAGEDF